MRVRPLVLLCAPTEVAVQSAHDALCVRAHEAAAAEPVQIHADGLAGYRAAYRLGESSTSESVCGPTKIEAASSRPVGFMFPGLGDHYLHMGEELYRSFSSFKAVVDRCAELLAPELGVDIRDVIYPASSDAAPREESKKLDFRKLLGRDERTPTADEQRLNQTRMAQPALFVIEYALATLLRTWGIQPATMIGYSLGEYVAACLAGVLSLEDSLSFVARRAELIETLPPGAMLAVASSEDRLLPLLGKHVGISAVNGPELCVVAGPPEEVDVLEKQLAERRVTVRRVKSSHAFHTATMAPIADQVAALARGYVRKAPTIPYASNVTGRLITAAEATDAEYWARHLTSPVRFSSGLRALEEFVLVEAGPGQTLSSIAIASLDPSEPARAVTSAMRSTHDPQSDTSVLFKAIGRLWASDAAVDWGCVPSRELPSAEHVEPIDAAPEPVETETERQLAELWKAIFRRSVPTPTTTFIELGGNSLTATTLVQRIQKGLGVKLSLRHVYGAPSLRAMAATVDEVRSNPAAPARRPAKPGAPAAALPRLCLPNGLVVAHQNEAETRHFYDDIFAHRSYVKHGLSIPDGACIFDVGANIGLFSLFAHREAKDVRVFAFEPAPPTFELLRANLAEHGVRATALNCGLSNAAREAAFTFYPRSSGMSSLYADEAEERHNLKTIIANQRRSGSDAVEQVASYEDELLDVRFQATVFTAKLRRISDVIREYGIEHIDLMKVDVQKAELEVIDGVDEEDWSKISQVVLEVHDTDDRVATLRARLERHGLSVSVHQDELYVGTNIYNLYALRGKP